jgi:hypothetical protein
VYAAILATMKNVPFDVITQLMSLGQNCAATHLADLLWLVGVGVCRGVALCCLLGYVLLWLCPLLLVGVGVVVALPSAASWGRCCRGFARFGLLG